MCILQTRAEHNARKAGLHGTEFSRSSNAKNIPMDRTQTVDEKNVFICLVIMYTLGVMVSKMSQLARFLLSQFAQNILVHLKGLIYPF